MLILSDLIIDALLGTGIKGAPKGLVQQVIDMINDVDKPVLSVDLPSGLDADTGAVPGCCVKASVTVTLAAPKVGLLVYPGRNYVGELFVADIGIPPSVLESAGRGTVLEAPLVKKALPARPPDGHKGTFGRLMILAGSPGMTGAAAMAAEAALRTGVGLVTVGVPQSLNDVLEVKLTEVMTLPLPETADRSLSIEALPVILEKMDGIDAVVIGPGLSRNAPPDSWLRLC